jgi:hypothetical protein
MCLQAAFLACLPFFKFKNLLYLWLVLAVVIVDVDEVPKACQQ